MTPEQAVRDAAARLTLGGMPSAWAEARTLVAHVAAVEAGRLLLAPDLTDVQQQRLTELVGRRVAGEPVQHLTGEAYFRTVTVAVGPGVFVPRPETEVMTGWALDHLGGRPGRVVELCAGSGAISLALVTENPALEVHAVELDPGAHAWAERNLASSSVRLELGDMADAFADLDGTVDLVIANPPYIPLEAWESVPADVRDHDPHLALFSGQDGLDALHVVADVSARLLRPGGAVCAEHADLQVRSAPEVFVRHGAYEQVRDHVDLAGRPRFVTATRSRVAGWPA